MEKDKIQNKDDAYLPEENIQLAEINKEPKEINEEKKEEEINKKNDTNLPENNSKLADNKNVSKEIKIISKGEENILNKNNPNIPEENLKLSENHNELKEINVVKDKYLLDHELTDLELQNDVVDQRFMEEIESLHPRKLNENSEYEKYSCCGTYTGWFTCSDEGLKCDLDSFGVGIVVYFKILKTLIICFLIVCILNIPLYVIYVNSNSRLITNYKDALYMTSIGNIGSTFQNGYYIEFQTLLGNNNYSLPLNCTSYNITNLLYFGISKPGTNEILNQQKCTNYSQGYELTLDGCNSAKSYLTEQLKQQCLNQVSCILNFDVSNFTNDCYTNDMRSNLYLSYECFQEYIKLPLNRKLDRPIFGFVVVIIDIASMLALILTVVIIPIQQRRNEKFYKENITQISDYSLYLDNLNINSKEIVAFLDNFVAHTQKVFDKEEIKFGICPIYELNYPVLTNVKLDLYLEKDNLREQKKDIRRKMKKKDDLKYKEELEKDSNELLDKIKILEEEIAVCSNNLTIIDDLFVTFTNQNYSSKFFEMYQKTKCTRCCIVCCCRKHEIEHLYFDGNWLDVKAFPDEPSNLKWQNIPYSECKRFLRQSFAILVAIIVILMSLGLVMGSKYLQQQMDKQINSEIDCSFVKIDNSTEVVAEFNSTEISNLTKIKTYCFCKDNLNKNGPFKTEKLIVDYVPICKTWVSLYIQAYSLSIGIIIVIPFINAILVIILRWLTEFERNKTVSIDKMSNIWKIFVMQLINTGLILLLVNTNVKSIKDALPNFPLFSGKYDDMTPQWFLDIGSTIAFSLILNVFVPHLSVIMQNCITLCKRCMDSGCGCDGKKSTLNKKEYSELYTGADFLIDCRYSELLTTLFVSLIYSSGLPILYVACFFSLLLTYWTDKWMLLNYYKKPPQYDLYMSKLFNSVILIGVIFHYLIGIWIYGNKNLLYNRNKELTNFISFDSYVDITSTVGKEIADRLNQPHNIICIIFLALLLAIVIIRYTFLQIILITCCKNCTQSSTDQIKTVELVTGIINFKKLYR